MDCPICFERFTSLLVPLIICSSGHNICRNCVSSDMNPLCPICRSPKLSNPIINRLFMENFNEGDNNHSYRPVSGSLIGFQFHYLNDPNEPRVFRKVAVDEWDETFPDGNIGHFKVAGRLTIPGDRHSLNVPLHGEELVRIPDDEQRLFIPDLQQPVMWLRFK